MTQMVRKQVYIRKRQRIALKRMARAQGVSEAELIRQAIDQQLSHSVVQAFTSNPKAWARARRFMLALRAREPLTNQPRAWKRDDLYEERLSRYGRRSD